MKRPGYLVSCTETLPNVASGTVDHTCLCSVLIIALCTVLIPILQVRKLRLRKSQSPRVPEQRSSRVRSEPHSAQLSAGMRLVGLALVAQIVKNLPTIQEIWVQSQGHKDPLEKGRLHTPVFLPGKSHA